METGELTDKFQRSEGKTLTNIVGMGSGYSWMGFGTVLLIGGSSIGHIGYFIMGAMSYIAGIPTYHLSVKSLKKK